MSESTVFMDSEPTVRNFVIAGPEVPHFLPASTKVINRFTNLMYIHMYIHSYSDVLKLLYNLTCEKSYKHNENYLKFYYILQEKWQLKQEECKNFNSSINMIITYYEVATNPEVLKQGPLCLQEI